MHTQLTPAQNVGQGSDLVFPSEPGVFYRYSSRFSTTSPLYWLLKCKSNKGRKLEEAKDFVHEIDLTFIFGNDVQVCSANAAPSIRLLNGFVSREARLNQTWIAQADMTAEAFYELREQKDASALRKTCVEIVAGKDAVVTLAPGVIVAVMTESGKYGLFLVKELTPSSLDIDACHVLL